MAPATAEEIAALVNARNQLTQANQPVHEDVVVGEALVMPERSASVIIPDSVDRHDNERPAPGVDETPKADLSGIDDSTPLETPRSVNARAAIFKARDQFRSRSASSRSSASPLLPSLPDGFGDEMSVRTDSRDGAHLTEQSPLLPPEAAVTGADASIAESAASLDAVRPARTSGPDVVDRFSSVPHVLPGFELPRAKRVTYQPPVAGLSADVDDAFTPSTAVRRTTSSDDRTPNIPVENTPWRWQPAPARDPDPRPVFEISEGSDAFAQGGSALDAERWSPLDDGVDDLTATAEVSTAATLITDELPFDGMLEDDRFDADVDQAYEDTVDLAPEVERPSRRARSWLPFASRPRRESVVDPEPAYLAEEVVDEASVLPQASESDVDDIWDNAPVWTASNDAADEFVDDGVATGKLEATSPGAAAATLDPDRYAEPPPRAIVQIDGRAELDDLVLSTDVEIAPDLPRVCRTCRDFRPAEGGERGWCTNTWAFDHRRMVDLHDQPCETSIGSWWLPADSNWQTAADISSHGDPTPLLDRWLPDFDEYPVRAVAGEWRRRRS